MLQKSLPSTRKRGARIIFHLRMINYYIIKFFRFKYIRRGLHLQTGHGHKNVLRKSFYPGIVSVAFLINHKTNSKKITYSTRWLLNHVYLKSQLFQKVLGTPPQGIISVIVLFSSRKFCPETRKFQERSFKAPFVRV
jgi:hypothetical protein